MDQNPTALRMLITDDEEEILELLGEYFKTRGYLVITAYDGQDALDVIRSGQVDLVISDLRMPMMSGLELLDEINALEAPVATILMTGFGDIETSIQAMQKGAYDYLLKPFKLRDVHAAVVRAGERLRREREVVQMRELLSFYEAAHACHSASRLPHLFGVMASVALDSCGADEVAIWLRSKEGWDAVARGGSVQALRRFDPAKATKPSVDEWGVLVEPILAHGKRVGVLAVAGGLGRTAEQGKRVEGLVGVLGMAIEKCRPATA